MLIMNLQCLEKLPQLLCITYIIITWSTSLWRTQLDMCGSNTFIGFSLDICVGMLQRSSFNWQKYF